MGNCLRRNHQEPDQPVASVAKPSAVNEHQISNRAKASKPLGGVSLSTYANTRKGAFNENHVNNRWQSCKPPQGRTSSLHSSTLKEKLKQLDDRYGNHFVTSTSMGDEVFHAYNKLNYFEYRTLKAATSKFSDKNLIGRGGFGDVYKGWIDFCTMNAAKGSNGRPVAVKKLRKEGHQGLHEWMNELNFLSRLNHQNVVKIIGYCCEGKHRILVYEYMAKGSLDAHLSRGGDSAELNWSRRIKIAIGSARSLEYLHTAAKPIIHRDVKSSNFLLDDGLNAKLSDFGLARYGPEGEDTHVSTRILGTRGYIAPEYVGTGRLTLKTDIYSFGVVLLEILSGSAAVKSGPHGMAGNLANWARPYLKNKQKLYRLVLDKRLRSDCVVEEAFHFARIILKCISFKPQSRPTMTQVVRALETLEQAVNSRNQN